MQPQEPLDATIDLDAERHNGSIDPRLFGALAEHMGRCIYTGLYEPEHPTADEHGFRTDVAQLATELGVTLVRYPGGNFVSNYRWEDGVGPRASRPHRLDLAWRSVESNAVGTDEFLLWTKRQGVVPMLAVNLATRGVADAAALVEYCNVPGGTALSDARRANGVSQPHDVKLWCLGNEMDGPWQIGHTDADSYGRLAAEAAKAMRRVDPGIELVACGSSFHEMPTFGHWESTVLEHALDVVDYISVHAYYEELAGDRRSFLASGFAMDRYVREVIATIDAVAARKKTRKRVDIAFDEWNVWYRSHRKPLDEVAIDVNGPRIEDIYSSLDAVVVGDLLVTLLNHVDRIRIACLAQLVNVIAPIMTQPSGPAWRQATFHPFALVAGLSDARGLQALVKAPELATAQYGDVPAVSAAAVHDTQREEVNVFVVNRHERPASVRIRQHGFAGWFPRDGVAIVADARGPLDRDAASAFGPRPLDLSAAREGMPLVLPPESWTMLTVSTSGARSVEA